MASEHLEYSVQFIWITSMIMFFFCPFWNLTAAVPIHIHYMEERRVNILINFSFVLHRRKKYDLNKHGGENIITDRTFGLTFFKDIYSPYNHYNMCKASYTHSGIVQQTFRLHHKRFNKALCIN